MEGEGGKGCCVMGSQGGTVRARVFGLSFTSAAETILTEGVSLYKES